MAIKSKTKDTPFPRRAWTHTSGSKNSSHETTNSFVTVRESFWQQSSQVTPGYRALVAAKQPLPVNDFWCGGYTQEPGVIRYESFSFGKDDPWYGNYSSRVGSSGPFYALAGATLPTMQLCTSNDLYLAARLKAKRDDWSVPIFLAEAGEATTMVYTAALRLVHGARALKKGRLDEFFRQVLGDPRGHRDRIALSKERYRRNIETDPTKRFASAWLEARWGWIPLVNDIQQAVETLTLLAGNEHRLSGHLTRTIRRVRSTTENNIILQVSPDIRGNTVEIRHESRKLSLRYTMDANRSIARSLGLTNPFEVAWELFPFTAVIDYIVPIGAYLSSIDGTQGMTFTGQGWEGAKVEVEKKVTASWTPQPKAAGNAFYAYKQWKVQRWPLSSLPQVIPSKLTIESNLNATKITNCIAVLRQLFR